MLEVTYDQLHAWLVAFFWPFVRLLAFIMAAPLWGHDSIPRQARIGLAALLAYVIAPSLPPLPAVPIISWPGLGILVEQLLIGVAMGLVMHVTLSVVMAAGEYIALKMGLGFATFFASDIGENTVVLARFLYMITLLMMLALNVHLVVIEILADSFTALPIGAHPLNADAFAAIARYGGTIFHSGLLLALPVIAALMIINLSLGILNRASPQLTIFSIGFPLTLTAGLALLMVLMMDFSRFLENLFQNGLNMLQQVISAMAG